MKSLVLACLALFATGAFGQQRIRSVTVTPVITAAAYANGDQIGVLQKIPNALPADSAGIDVRTWQVIDKAKVKHDLDFMIFSKQVTVTSADNAAVNVSDADMVDGFIGTLSVAEANYVDSSANSVSTNTPDSLLFKGSSGTGKDLWMLIVCRDAGGCDYAAVDDLVLRLTFLE